MNIKIAHVGPFLIFFFAIAFSFSTLPASASSCTTYGNTTYCDDGTSYSQYGNTIYGSDGTSYSTYGNTTYGSDGSSASTYGNTTYTSDGTSYSRYGNNVYGSDGSSYSTYGNTTYGSGNTYNTCPTNSSKDSLTGKCSCNYGYSVSSNKTSCVYTGSTYTAPTFSRCPLNSSANSSGGCSCNYGYSVNSSKTSCMYVGTYKSTYSGSYSAPSYSYSEPGNSCPAHSSESLTDPDMCSCNSGYQVNAAKTKCVKISKKTNDKLCQATFGNKSEWNGKYDKTNDQPYCKCKKKYEWNDDQTSCIKP